MRSRPLATSRCLIALTLCAAGCRAEPAVPGVRSTASSVPVVDRWIDARTRGVDLRASGQEPGWYVDVDHERSIRLVWDYGDRDATFPAARPIIAGGRTRYSSATDAHLLTVVAEELPCRDGMSGQPFPLTVTVTIDGRELHGCGRALGTEQTSWRADGSSVGPIRVGMSRAEVAAALGASAGALRRTQAAERCELVPVPRLPGVLVMFIDDRVARIDVVSSGVATAAGVEVGIREERVRDAYPTQLTVTPHKYVDGRYFTLAPDATHRIVIETEDAWVTRYRVGRLPEVEWVEGCG